MLTATGSLTMVGLNGPNPSIFWNGRPVPNVTSIRVDWDSEEQRVKVKVSDIDPALQAELLAAGVLVRKEKNHEGN